jgi:hypothetical protein
MYQLLLAHHKSFNLIWCFEAGTVIYPDISTFLYLHISSLFCSLILPFFLLFFFSFSVFVLKIFGVPFSPRNPHCNEPNSRYVSKPNSTWILSHTYVLVILFFRICLVSQGPPLFSGVVLIKCPSLFIHSSIRLHIWQTQIPPFLWLSVLKRLIWLTMSASQRFEPCL